MEIRELQDTYISANEGKVVRFLRVAEGHDQHVSALCEGVSSEHVCSAEL